MHEYAVTIAVFTAACGTLTLLFSTFWIFVEGLGLLSLLLEAGLGVPQFLENHRRKSTEGMRFSVGMTDLLSSCKVTHGLQRPHGLQLSVRRHLQDRVLCAAGCAFPGSLRAGYFYCSNSARLCLQFAFCGSLQICLDVALLMQVLLYSGVRAPLKEAV